MTMKHRFTLLLPSFLPKIRPILCHARRNAAIGALVGSGIAFLPASGSAEVAARVGDREVSLEQLKKLLPELTPAEAMSFAANPETFNQYVRSLLIRQIVLESAVQNQWDLNPKARQAIERASESALVESYLQAIASVPEEFPSEEQLQAFYEANRTSFRAPEQFRISQIFLAVGEGENSTAVQAEARTIREAVAAGEIDFSEAARRYSEDEASAQNGGSVGWLTEETLQPDLRPIVSSLQANEVSDVIELTGGFHILRLDEKQDAFTIPFADVRDRLASQLRARRAQANREAFLERLIQENSIALNELFLARLLEEETDR